MGIFKNLFRRNKAEDKIDTQSLERSMSDNVVYEDSSVDNTKVSLDNIKINSTNTDTASLNSGKIENLGGEAFDFINEVFESQQIHTEKQNNKETHQHEILNEEAYELVTPNNDENVDIQPYDPKLDLELYKYPTLDLLNDSSSIFYTIVDSDKFRNCDYELPVILGRNQNGESLIIDLAEMPHLLIAGATNTGKTSAIQAMLMSLLYKKHPAELKLVIIDTKTIDYGIYNKLSNHFLAQVEGNEENEAPIVTSPDKAKQIILSIQLEIENRFDLIRKAKQRNIQGYNNTFCARQLSPYDGHRYLPYIVVVIDDFSILNPKEFVPLLTKLAQVGRSVGVHLIVSTQITTRDNLQISFRSQFTARMAFNMLSNSESILIIGNGNASKLTDIGTCYFQYRASTEKIQTAHLDYTDIDNLIDYINCQQGYFMTFPLPYVEKEGYDNIPDVDMNHLDPLFVDAARLIVATQQGCTSMIQRKFDIGYNRSCRLMDQLEKAGIVGQAHGSKPREVLCQSNLFLDIKLKQLNK